MSKTKKALSLMLALCMVLALAPTAALASAPKVTISQQYLFAGKNNEWYTEESYYPSPVVTDLDGDGTLEVLNAAYSLSVMDAATGAEKWRVNAGKDRSSGYSDSGNVASGQVFCNFKVLDVDADGKKEIVIGYGNGSISVLDNQGNFKPGWPKNPANRPISSLAVDDLNRDGKMEIIVGLATADSAPDSVYVYHCDGTLASGWPQLDRSKNGGNYSLTQPEYLSKTAYSAGIFANGICTGDLNGDGKPEIIVPVDAQYINAYYYDGSLVKASDIFSDQHGSRMWGKIGLWEDYNEEIAHKNEGWGWSDELGSRATTYQGQLANGCAVYTDVDGDGTSEVVVTALMWDRTTYVSKGNNVATIADTRYMTAFIFNQDRSRYVNEKLGFDWTSAPNELTSDISGPLKKNDASSMTGGVIPVPTCVDLDGDGYQEILFNSYDGKVHCFSLDKKSWSFTMPKTTSTVYEYASPITCVDLDGDGTKEVIFSSWTDCEPGNKRGGIYGGTGVNGALYVLSSDGKLLASQDLHNGYCTWEDRDNPSAGFTNGVMSAPTVQDIDGDGKYEVLLNTTYYALCAYDLDVEKVTPPAPKVILSQQNLTVDGETITCEMYNIDGSNYFKLRDVASFLNNTGSQFEVDFDSESNRVIITTGAPYTPLGTELSDKIEDKSSTAKKSEQTIVIDGQERSDLTAFNIGGNNFFQLRELGTALGFDVDYDNATKTAVVKSR